MENENKIIVAMPIGFDVMKAKTTFALIHALRELDCEYDMVMTQGCDLVEQRTLLVKDARKLKGTHILFVDHDMFFPPHAIQTLLEDDKDIVGVEYNKRRLPLETTAIPLTSISKQDKETLYKCNALGTGLLLIKLSVFEKMPEPWFKFGRDAEGKMVFGEDTFFCQEAIKAGFDVWCDPSIRVSHIGDFYY